MVFLEAPGTPARLNVGTPQGFRIFPLLFLLYMTPLHFKISQGLMISYVDCFALTAASLAYQGNIRRFQELFEKLDAKAHRLDISFSVAKRELIHWTTTSQRHSLMLKFFVYFLCIFNTLPYILLLSLCFGSACPPLTLLQLRYILWCFIVYFRIISRDLTCAFQSGV